MLVFHERPVSLIVLFAVALHLWWAAMILVDRAALSATGVASLARHIQPPGVLAAVIAAAALAALVGISSRFYWAFLLMMPQQVLLMMSASGAVEAMWLSQYADGVVRPWTFIAADQMYSVLTAIGHTLAIISHAVVHWKRDDGSR